MEEINLKELMLIILKRWWILAICTVLCTAAAVWWSYHKMNPVYQTSTTLYVGKSIDTEGILSSDLSLGTQLINDYREIAKSRMVASTVIEELGIKDISAAAMAGKVSVNQRGETRVIQISVADTNPQMAKELANQFAEAFKKKVTEIMQIENVQIIDKAELPTYPVSPNKKRITLFAFALGFAIGIGIIFLLEYLDDTVKTPDDIHKYLDLPVVGTIPVFPKKI